MIRFEKNQLHFQLLSHFYRITHNMTRVKLQAPKIKSFCSSESFPFITPRNSSLSLSLSLAMACARDVLLYSLPPPYSWGQCTYQCQF